MSPMSGSVSSPVASCEVFPKSQNEASAPGNFTSPAAVKSSQANIKQAAVLTPTKNYSFNVAQPNVSLHTKFTGLSRPLYPPVTPTSSVATVQSSSSHPSASSITSSLSATQPVSFSPLSNKRAAFLNKHMRSKSSHFPGMISPPPSPLSAITPNSPTTTTRIPLMRSTSLPTVPQYERAKEKFIPTLSSLSSSPSPINTNNSWRNGMPIPTASEGTRNYRFRERSPSRRPSSSSGFYSTSPKASLYSPLHHSPRELRWTEDTYASSISSSSPSLCSSGPSTPSSIRSRSPSISSLETIPDSPDAEAEALEAERLAEEARKLAITEEEEEEEEEEEHESVQMTRSASSPISERSFRRRSHMGLEGIGGFMLPTLRAGNTGLSTEEKRRKRWSVCGGEKRADLELETIWEDRVVAVQSPPQRSLVGIAGTLEYEEYHSHVGFGGDMI